MRSRLIDQYMDTLLSGNRAACREIIQKEIKAKAPGKAIFEQILWPAMQQVEKLFRADRINIVTEQMATRINRSMADQAQLALKTVASKGKRILIMCAEGESEELGAQMCADLFEADGWEVYFLGGGAPNDEILGLCGQLRLNMLLVFGTKPQGVPGIRALVDLIREVNSNPTMNIMVSGGVYNRADGLWEEINADLFAPDAKKAIDIANLAEPRSPDTRHSGGVRKRRRRRQTPELAGAV